MTVRKRYGWKEFAEAMPQPVLRCNCGSTEDVRLINRRIGVNRFGQTEIAACVHCRSAFGKGRWAYARKRVVSYDDRPKSKT